MKNGTSASPLGRWTKPLGMACEWLLETTWLVWKTPSRLGVQVRLFDVEQVTGSRVEQSTLVSGLIVATLQGTTAYQQGAELVSIHIVPHNLTGELSKHQLTPSDELDVADHGKPPENGQETHQVDSVTPGLPARMGDAEAAADF